MSLQPAKPATAVVSLLQDVLRKVEASVLVKIQDHVHPPDSSLYHPQNDGIDFLDTKNTLLLSYMIDLVVHVRHYFITVKERRNEGGTAASIRSENNSSDDIRSNEVRLMEMKVLLDKISTGLDRKLRYQIDKVLLFAATSTTATGTTRQNHHSSSTFASRTDPLQFRPGIVQQHQNDTIRSNDEDEVDDENDDDDNDTEDEDDDYKAARQTIRMSSVTAKTTSSSKTSLEEEQDDHPNNGDSHVYRAPRFMSTPYPNERNTSNKNELPNEDGDYNDSPQVRQKEERYKQKLRNSEIVQTLREQLNDHRPEQDDIVGTGTGVGGPAAPTHLLMNRDQQKFRQAQRDKLQFEEDYMIRLPRTKTERKQEHLYQRQREQNTISSITADLHQITGSHHHHRSTGSSSHHQRPPPPPSDSKRKSVPKNALQAALFGGSSKKKKMKR